MAEVNGEPGSVHDYCALALIDRKPSAVCLSEPAVRPIIDLCFKVALGVLQSRPDP